MKVTLGPIIIGVTDIEKAKAFYQNVFGIEILQQSDNYVSARLGDAHIELEEDSSNRFPAWAEHNIGTYKNSEFVVENIDEFVAEVNKNGGQLISGPVKRPWGSVNAEIADPDGNIFLVSQ